MFRIIPCESRKDLKRFEEVPESLFGNDPNFVPPFAGSVVDVLDKSHPFHSRGDILPFIAWQNEKPIGRIAVIRNHAHNEYHNDKTGFFGFLDSIDDNEVFNQLVDVALNQAGEWGLECIRGPYNPSSNDECGLLVDGFDTPPFVLMPYNPSYYLNRYEQAGLVKVKDLFSYHLSEAEKGLDRTKKIVERFAKQANITVRSANLKNLDEEVRILHYLYNETLGEQWGFVPVSIEDLQHSVKDLKQVLDPEMVLIAEKDGEPIGISVTIPNINEFMLRAKKSKGLLRTLKFIWYLKTRRPAEARLAILGVLPDHRRKGVAPTFYFESLRRGKEKYVGGEIGWVLDNNDEVNKAAGLMGAKQYKTYRIFEKKTL